MKIIGKTTFSLLFLLVATLLTALQSHAQERMTRAEYIAKWRHIAIDNMETYGIPASITMAQGLLESGAGNSELARKSNNHFGIKCKSTWTGDKVYHDDDAKGECFRAYPTVEESYEDHAEFLNVNKRSSPTTSPTTRAGRTASKPQATPQHPTMPSALSSSSRRSISTFSTRLMARSSTITIWQISWASQHLSLRPRVVASHSPHHSPHIPLRAI